MANNIPFSPSPYPPRAIVQVNGINVTYTSIRIDTNDYFCADEFSVVLPLFGQKAPLDFRYWASSPQFEVKIFAGYPQNSEQFTVNDLTLIFMGEADSCPIDPVGGTVHLSGRDLSGRLLDKKTTRKFSNYTASQLAIFLANENGLTPVVTPTHTTLGTFYILDQTLSVRQRTEWDLLTAAANAEGFVAYIEADKLIFKPLPTSATNPYVIYYEDRTLDRPYPISNTEHITFSRDLTLSQDVIVEVRVPFDTATGQAFTVKAQANNETRKSVPGLPKSREKKQIYSFIRSGISKEQALQFAQSTLRGISLHTNKLFVTMPGDITFKKDTIIKVQGTNTDFDNIYYSSHTLRTILPNGGFRMTFEAKNMPPGSQIIL